MKPREIRSAVEKYLFQPLGVSQFTIDWAEVQLDNLEESDVSTSTLLQAMHYNVGNIIEIMDKTIPDYKWFNTLKGMLKDLPVRDTSGADGWPAFVGR